MQHQWQWVRETDTDNVFQCQKCLLELGFNKPGIGEPSATDKVPSFIDDYAIPSECTGAMDAENTDAALIKAVFNLKPASQFVAEGVLTQSEADGLSAKVAPVVSAQGDAKK